MPPPTPPLTYYPTTTNTTETGQTARYTDSTLAVSIVSGLVGLFVLLLIIIAIIYCRMRWKRTSFSFARKSHNQSAFADIRMVSSTNQQAGGPPNEPSNGRRKTKRRSESGMSVLPGGNKSSSSAALERARAGNASSRAVTIELHPTPMFSVDEHSAVDNPVDELAVHTTRTSAVDEQEVTIKANQANPFFSMSLK